MPSTVVHAAFGLLIAAGLLGAAFDRRAVAVVLAAVVIPDLDTGVSLAVEGTHRAALHTVLIPAGLAVLVYYDTRVRESSWLRSRYGWRGVRLAWVGVLVYAVAGVALDLFTPGGVNVLYPVYDQFVTFAGEIDYTTGRGWSQTFVEIRTPEPPDPGAGADAGGGGDGGVSVDVGQRGSTEEARVSSGVNPNRGKEPKGVERRFPIAFGGWQLLFVLSSAVVTAVRLRTNDYGPGRRDDT